MTLIAEWDVAHMPADVLEPLIIVKGRATNLGADIVDARFKAPH